MHYQKWQTFGPMDAKSPLDASFRALQPGTLSVEPLNPGISHLFSFGNMLFRVQGSKVLGSAPPPAKKTAGQIEKETMPFWPSFIRVLTFVGFVALSSTPFLL